MLREIRHSSTRRDVASASIGDVSLDCSALVPAFGYTAALWHERTCGIFAPETVRAGRDQHAAVRMRVLQQKGPPWTSQPLQSSGLDDLQQRTKRVFQVCIGPELSQSAHEGKDACMNRVLLLSVYVLASY